MIAAKRLIERTPVGGGLRKALKLLSPLLEGAISPTARKVRREKLTYLNVFKLRRLEKAMLEMEQRGVPGVYIEFGVALGGSAILLARAASAQDREFHGFDVFATIPPPVSEKDDEKSKQRYEVIKSGASTGIGGDEYYGYKDNLFDEVRASFDRFGVPVDQQNVHLHKGLFEDTWPGVTVNGAALIHIDCDWYDPVAYCLAAVADLLSPGGLIVLDDYHDYGGARLAVDEFLAKRPDFSMRNGSNPFLRKSPTSAAGS